MHGFTICCSQSQDNEVLRFSLHHQLRIHICLCLILLSYLSNSLKKGVGKGQFGGKTLPTYIYTDCIKTVVKEVVGGELGDYPDPQGSAVCIYYWNLLPRRYWFAACISLSNNTPILLCFSWTEYWYSQSPQPSLNFMQQFRMAWRPKMENL